MTNQATAHAAIAIRAAHHPFIFVSGARPARSLEVSASAHRSAKRGCVPKLGHARYHSRVTLEPRPNSRETLDFAGVGCGLGLFVFAVGFATMVAAARGAPDWFPARAVGWPLLLAICFWVHACYIGFVWDNRTPVPWDEACAARDRRRARRIRWITGFAVVAGLVELVYGFELVARFDRAGVRLVLWIAVALGFIVMHATWTLRAVERPPGVTARRADGLRVALVLTVLYVFLTPASIYRFVWWNHDELVELCLGHRPDSFDDWELEPAWRVDGIEGVEGKVGFAWTGWSELSLVYAPDGVRAAADAERGLPRPLFGPWYYRVDD